MVFLFIIGLTINNTVQQYKVYVDIKQSNVKLLHVWGFKTEGGESVVQI